MPKANRPIFLPSNNKDKLIEIINIEFEWFMGMSLPQRVKSMKSLHDCAKKQGICPVLEISTKSEETLGVKLSAFNLLIRINNRIMTVESAYQGSKIFEKGGQYQDLYNMPSREIKVDDRLKKSGKIIGFNFLGDNWPVEPKTAFYDWLYLSALIQNKQLSDSLFKYKGFSDIAFNPKKSISCQARSAAIFVSLHNRGYLPELLDDKNLFLKVLDSTVKENNQQKLFF